MQKDFEEAGSVAPASRERSTTELPPIVGIGASAGGLEAVKEMLRDASEDDGLAYVLVQHLDPNHESMMAELIGRSCSLPVRQIEDGDEIRANEVYVIPPGFGLDVRRGVLHLIPFSEPRGMRRPIDDFFHSLAYDQGLNAACVILSGTGADGSSGLRAIKEHGGICIAQTPETARYDGMPISAVGTGLIDFALSPEEIVGQIKDFFLRRREKEEIEADTSVVADHLEELCGILRDTVGHDFAGYKRSTLVRRIGRRMQLLAIDDAQSYARRIRDDRSECEALFRDLLINVTAFFRDAELFDVLRDRAIVPLVSSAAVSDVLRIWIPGCSSGEEAYSIAMLFDSAVRDLNKQIIVQIFATDIDEAMLSIAREGRYPLSALGDIPEEFRDRYTIGSEGHFSLVPRIRDMIRFSAHSIIKDPPFSRLDLISCRNLLIYMGDRTQESLLPLMHYSLKAGGFLFLGPSESIGRFEQMFAPIEQKARLFRRKDGSVSYPIDLPVLPGGQPRSRHSFGARPQRREAPILADPTPAVQRVIGRYAPPHAVADQNGEIVSTSGRLSKYLDFPAGEATSNIIKMARSGLREALGPMMRRVAETGNRTALRDVAVRSEFGEQTITLVVDPLPDSTLLILFLDEGRFREELQDDYAEQPTQEEHVHDLEEQLRQTRFRLRSTVEELETANEELKSSNEEMMSMNEELQSANEELSTVNEELKNKVDQIAMANDDLSNFLDSTELALISLDSNLRIRRFTEPAEKIFSLKESDKGRQISEIRQLVSDKKILADTEKVITGGKATERLVYSLDGNRTYSMRILPYRTDVGAVEGATLTFADVTALRELESDLLRQSQRLQLAMSIGGMGVWDYDRDSGRLNQDPSVRALFGFPLEGEVTLDMVMERIDPRDRDRIRLEFSEAVQDGSDFAEIFRVSDPDAIDGTRWIRGISKMIEPAGGGHFMIGINYDVSEEERAKEHNHILLREMNHRVKNLFAVISSIIALAAREASSLPELVEDLRSRINALARAHEVTQGQAKLEVVDFGSLLKLILTPYMKDGAVQLEGPEITIAHSVVTPIGLIMHEWATNSMKYGSLSSRSGTVRVDWRLVEERECQSVELIWTEIGGPKVGDAAMVSGFGRRLVDISAQQIAGETTYDWREDGLVARLRFDRPD